MRRERHRLAVAAREAGLHQVTYILQKYGIDSETDLSELDQHDFSELEPVVLHTKAILVCKETGALVSSGGCRYKRNVAFLVKYPATVALLSSEALPAMRAAERSSQHVESKDFATESESDAHEEVPERRLATRTVNALR